MLDEHLLAEAAIEAGLPAGVLVDGGVDVGLLDLGNRADPLTVFGDVTSIVAELDGETHSPPM